MHTTLASIAVALAVLLGAASTARAGGDAELSRLEELEARLLALEDRLAASEATVAAQRERLRAQELPDVAQGSAVDTFFSNLEVGGHMAVSYVYNFNNPDGTGVAPNASQPFNQFNANHNTFELDAFKLEIGRPTDGPGTAGFQLDLLYGANNLILCGGAGTAADTNLCLQQAYMSYDWNGTLLRLGKWETLLGAEVIDSIENHHVQHGILFTWAIPLVHVGLLASGSLNENTGWALGLANGFNNATDFNDNKGILGQLSFEEGPLYTSLSAFVGSEEARTSINPPGTVGNDNDNVQIYDLVMTYQASDTFELWLNADYGFLERNSAVVTAASPFASSAPDEDPQWFGVAGGFAVGLNEKTTLALRGEWFRDDGGARFNGISSIVSPPNDATYTSGTATLSYRLTDNLTARAEFRHDVIDTDPVDYSPFPQHDRGTSGEDQNDVGLLEVSYSFD